MKRFRRLAQCEQKRAYPDRAAAESGRHGTAQRAGSALDQLRSYRCRHCGGWHIGHVPGSFSKR